MIRNPQAVVGAEEVNYMANSMKGAAIIALLTAGGIALVLAASSGAALASTGSLGTVIAVCRNHRGTAVSVLAVLSSAAAAAAATGIPQEALRRIRYMIT